MMENVSTGSSKSFMGSLLRLPLNAAWFLIKHPVVSIIIALLIAFSSISFLAHYNEAIAQRFNSAMGFFLGATLTSEASDALRSANRKLLRSSAELKSTKAELKLVQANKDTEISKSKSRLLAELNTQKTIIEEKNSLIKRQQSAITRKNRALKRSAAALHNGSIAVRKLGSEVERRNAHIRNHNNRLNDFRERGIALEENATKRFKKVAIYDAAGEFMGWFPIVGDVASIGLAATGVYEMCQMFREIELATDELGVKYKVYTDTFCEKPAEKTGEVIAERTAQIKGKAIAMTAVLQEYASNVSPPDTSALVGNVKTALENVYASFGSLHD